MEAALSDEQRGALPRCAWATGDFLRPYHDEEWGVPVHEERRHFEFLVLESAQAGLSWITILKRRQAYREAFCDFDPDVVARFGPADVDRLLRDSGIIRNRRKVESAISNARAFLGVQDEHGSFDDYIRGLGRKPAPTAESHTVTTNSSGLYTATLQCRQVLSRTSPLQFKRLSTKAHCFCLSVA